ncbi:OPT oligopeptide transporter protein-domain-containing protein [Lipomyces tetrasporus]|uniref:OPT oligopeptide transporter protein-domain-containing protein n=1 Tax=Lipomyces tetrasporus TaxID=54092 RepID=A0AAD7QL55_9ASCO|nr:OPT oligopeptide transporter protein-domain-containing protein [Lipomyces tetrasporus]KAJ8097257.1 OPT oligopeptide transporter protein-domain-containing protein [Lipomyces tetrasporus]
MREIEHIADEVDEKHLVEESTGFVYERMCTMSLDEALCVLRSTIKDLEDDINFPMETLYRIRRLLEAKRSTDYNEDPELYELDARIEAAWIKFHSPYPEIRAVTDPSDDPNIPIETLRVYMLGIIWVIIGSFINEIFFYRQPRLQLDSTVLQLLLYPCGKLTEYLPDWGFWIRSSRYSMNPGPWNAKEQMLATIILNIGAERGFFMTYVVAMREEQFFNQKFIDFGFMFLMNVSMIFMGFGFSGVLRKWVVSPQKTMWPTVLPTLALNRALLITEKKTSTNGWTISSYRFFFIVFGASFVYFFFPEYIFKALSVFNWITWINPKSVTLAIICGQNLGLGFNPISTFDWAVVNLSDPLVVPFFSVMNKYAGMFFSSFLLLGMYWTNYKFTAYLPPNSNDVYDKYGDSFDVGRVMDENKLLNVTAYRTYSPLYISMGGILQTSAFFMVCTLSLSYVLLTERKRIWQVTKQTYQQFRHPRAASVSAASGDPLTRGMDQYKTVPDWWFAVIFLVSFAFLVIAITVYPTNVPIWSVIVIMILAFVVLIPGTFIYATTGYAYRFHNVSVILAGFIVPGNGLAALIGRAIASCTDEQAQTYLSDMKMAHYARLPPRPVFRAQIIAAFFQTFVTIGGVQFLFASIPDMCSLTQKQRFLCPSARAFFVDALIYGVIGPERMLNDLYPALKYCFVVGVGIAVVFVSLRSKFSNALRYIHPVIIVSGIASWGSNLNLSHYTPGVIMSFIFMFYIKRYFLGWWTKYNFVLTAALSAGVAFSALFILLTLYYSRTNFEWWGNTISTSGVDGAMKDGLLPIPGEGFGLKEGEYW